MLPNGNLAFTSGVQGQLPTSVRAVDRGAPKWHQTYVQQMSGLEYRSYFESTLYGPLPTSSIRTRRRRGPGSAPTAPRATTSSAAPPACPATPPSRPRAQSTYTWARAPPTPAPCRSPAAPAASPPSGTPPPASRWTSTSPTARRTTWSSTSLDWDSTGPGRAGADQQRGDGRRAEHRSRSRRSSRGSTWTTQVSGRPRDHVHEAGRAQRRAQRPVPRPAPPRPRSFLKQDATTQGTWIGTYGTQGYDVIGGATSLPSYATVTPSGESTYTWTTSTTDPRACRSPAAPAASPPSGTPPPASRWTSTSPTARQHDLELYFDRLGQPGRAEQVQITNAATGAVLSTQSVSSFQSGALPGLRGQRRRPDHVHGAGGAERRAQRPVPRPGRRPGDALPSRTRRRRELDRHLRRRRATTSSAAAASLPSYATVTPAGQSTYTWATSTTDPRALQDPGGTSRIAAGWYSPPASPSTSTSPTASSTTWSCTSSTGTTRAGPSRCRSATRRRAPCWVPRRSRRSSRGLYLNYRSAGTS